MERFFVSVALVAAIALAAACGNTARDAGSGGQAGVGGSSGSSGTGAGGNEADAQADGEVPDAACTAPPDTTGNALAIAEAFCTPHAGCCSQVGLGFDTAACVAKFVAEAQPRIDVARCNGGEYDSVAVAECIQALESASAKCSTYSGDFGKVDPAQIVAIRACRRVIQGTKAPGEPCDSNFDCEHQTGTDTTCVGSVGGSYACIRTTFAPEGATCDPLSEPIEVECDPLAGLKCGNDECKALAEVGELCNHDTDCVASASCENYACEPRSALGEACADNCALDLACVGGVCSGELGAPCSSDDECGSSHCISGVCTAHNFWTEWAGVHCQ